MRYMYAIIDDIGRCSSIYRSTEYVCDRNHVPVQEISLKYLSKYYYPIPDIVDSFADFTGKWYKDINHTIEEVAL